MNKYVAGQKVKTYMGSDAVVIKQNGFMVTTDIGEFHWTKILEVEELSENIEESAQDEAIIDNSITIKSLEETIKLFEKINKDCQTSSESVIPLTKVHVEYYVGQMHDLEFQLEEIETFRDWLITQEGTVEKSTRGSKGLFARSVYDECIMKGLSVKETKKILMEKCSWAENTANTQLNKFRKSL